MASSLFTNEDHVPSVILSLDNIYIYIYIFFFFFIIMNRMVSHAALKLVQVILTPGFRKVFFHHSLSENFAPKAKPRMT